VQAAAQEHLYSCNGVMQLHPAAPYHCLAVPIMTAAYVHFARYADVVLCWQLQLALCLLQPTLLPTCVCVLCTLQGWLDAFDDQLPPLRNFILPSGGKAAAHLHMARSVSNAMLLGSSNTMHTCCWVCSVCKQWRLATSTFLVCGAPHLETAAYIICDITSQQLAASSDAVISSTALCSGYGSSLLSSVSLQVCRRAERSVVPLVRQELVDFEVRGCFVTVPHVLLCT
jgi:hypothetical protein